MTDQPDNNERSGLTRRNLLVGGGVTAGLVVAWGLWPRQYVVNVNAAPNEQLFGAFLKIASDGQIVAVVPQSEMGQGVYTLLPQIIADELGADWRTVAVQSAAIGPLYANEFMAEKWSVNHIPAGMQKLMGGDIDRWATREFATRDAFMVTAGSSSERAFSQRCREAGAAARVLLCQAAADRWDVEWESCDTKDGFVVNGDKKLRFGELAIEAVAFDLPDPLPLRPTSKNGLAGRDVQRLDLPSKVDGTASFAGDIRLPDMAFAAIRQGPIGNTKLKSFNRNGTSKLIGFLDVVDDKNWIAAVATNWWEANRALDLLAPVFETKGKLPETEAMESALSDALTTGDGVRFISRGTLPAIFANNKLIEAEYQVAPAVHAAIETRTATASFKGGKLQLWLATQAPNAARRLVASRLSMDAADITIYQTMAGGSFGRNLDNEIAVQAAIIARKMKRPVQLVYSRAEDFMHDHYRAPAFARLSAAVDAAGRMQGLQTKIAVPATAKEQGLRLDDDMDAHQAMRDSYGQADILSVEGAEPPYTIPNFALDHHPAYVGVPTGRWRSNAHSYSAFFTESFVDELAHNAKMEPLSYRMQMIGDQTRLARCLTGVAVLSEWDGGLDGSGKGLACHMMRGSYVAIVATARKSESGIKVDRISAMVDCGRLTNPDIARQQIEGGIIFGLAMAMGASTTFEGGLPNARKLRDINLPGLADVPKIDAEFVESDDDPGGIGEIAVPPVAPAIANALFSATGVRFRQLPLLAKGL